jgi:hypothetical protein
MIWMTIRKTRPRPMVIRRSELEVSISIPYRMFAPIHDLFQTLDYLPMINGSIIADILIIAGLYYTPLFESRHLKRWYSTFHIGAAMADILILVIGMILARAVFTYFELEWNVWKFLLVALVIQILHDSLFYVFFMAVPRGTNRMMDVFQDYAKEVSFKAILGDSVMLSMAVLLSSYLAS